MHCSALDVSSLGESTIAILDMGILPLSINELVLSFRWCLALYLEISSECCFELQPLLSFSRYALCISCSKLLLCIQDEGCVVSTFSHHTVCNFYFAS